MKKFKAVKVLQIKDKGYTMNINPIGNTWYPVYDHLNLNVVTIFFKSSLWTQLATPGSELRPFVPGKVD
jgi:hypothetical protein